MEKLRIDKYVWAIRLYKTRTAATNACIGGKIKIEGENQKPSRLIQIGDVFTVRINHQLKTIKVVKLIEKRVGAAIAQECYEDITPEEDKIEVGKTAFYKNERRERGTGRPTKKERRDIDKYKTDELDHEIF